MKHTAVNTLYEKVEESFYRTRKKDVAAVGYHREHENNIAEFNTFNSSKTPFQPEWQQIFSAKSLRPT